MATKTAASIAANRAKNNASITAANTKAGVTGSQQLKANASALASMNAVRTSQNLAPQTYIQGSYQRTAPGQKVSNITANKGQVYKDGKLVADYGYGDQANANAARYISSKGQSFGPIARSEGATTGKTYYGSPASPTPAIKISNPISWNSQYPSSSTSTAPGYSDATGATTEAPEGFVGGSTGARPILDGSQYQTTMPEAPKSLADIRADQLSQAQSAIDATQALFAEQQRQISATGASQLAQTSSNLVGAGLAGSPFAQTGEAGVQQNTQYELNAVAAQRSSDISGIMQQAEANAQNLYQQAIENYRSDRDFAVSERDSAMAQQRLEQQDAEAKQEAAKEASKSTVLNLAKSGYSLDEMNPQEYKALLAKSGMTDFEARAIWAASSPAANATYTTQNGFIVGTYFDPHTGKPVVTTTKLPDSLLESVNPDIQSLTLADGSVVLYDASSPFQADGKTLKTIDYSGSDVKDVVEDVDTSAPTTREFGGQTYQWNESSGEWDAMDIPEAPQPTLSTEDIRKTPESKKLQGIAILNDAIDTYSQLIEDKGSASGFTPNDRALLDGAKTKTMLAIKEAELLGAIQGADIGLIEGLIPDVTVEGFFNSLVPSPFVAGRALKTLEQAKGQYAGTAQSHYDFLISSGADPNNSYMLEVAKQLKLKQPLTEEERQSVIDKGGDPDAEDFSSVDGDTKKADISKAISSSHVKVKGKIQPALTTSTVKLGSKTVTVNSAVSQRLAMADADYFKATGKHIPVSESFRSSERQQELFKKLSARGARVAPPGYSFHELGMAVDVGDSWKDVKPYLNKYGFINGLKNDMGHFSVGELS